MSTNPPQADSEVFLKEVLSKLNIFSDDLKSLLQAESLLSSDVAEQLNNISETINSTIGCITKDLQSLGMSDESPVLALLELTNIKCTLETLASRVFRQSILPYEPTGEELRQTIYSTQYPLYKTLVPALPTNATGITFILHMSADEKISLRMDLDMSATDVIHDIAQRIQLAMANPDEYILKVIGRHEYLYGNTPISEFLSVREAVRRRLTLDIEMIQRKSINMADVTRILDLGRQIKREFFHRAGIEPPQELVYETDSQVNWDEDLLKIQDRFNNKTQRAGGLTLANTNMNDPGDEESDSDVVISQLRSESSRSRSKSRATNSLYRSQNQFEGSVSKSRSHFDDESRNVTVRSSTSTGPGNGLLPAGSHQIPPLDYEDGDEYDDSDVVIRPLHGFSSTFDDNDYRSELALRRPSTDITSQVESFRQSMGIINRNGPFGTSFTRDNHASINEVDDDDEDAHDNNTRRGDNGINSRFNSSRNGLDFPEDDHDDSDNLPAMRGLPLSNARRRGGNTHDDDHMFGQSSLWNEDDYYRTDNTDEDFKFHSTMYIDNDSDDPEAIHRHGKNDDPEDSDDYYSKVLMRESNGPSGNSGMFTSPRLVLDDDDTMGNNNGDSYDNDNDDDDDDDLNNIPIHHRRRSSAFVDTSHLELNDSDEEDLRAFSAATMIAAAAASSSSPAPGTGANDTTTSATPASPTPMVTGVSSPAPVITTTPRNGGMKPPPIPTTPKRATNAAPDTAASDEHLAAATSTPLRSTPPSQSRSLQPSSSGGMGSAHKKNKFFRFSTLHVESPSNDLPSGTQDMASGMSISIPSSSGGRMSPHMSSRSSSLHPPPPPPRDGSLSTSSASMPLSSSSTPLSSMPSLSSTPLPLSSSSSMPSSTTSSLSPMNVNISGVPSGSASTPVHLAVPPVPLPPPVPYDTSFQDTSREHLFIPPVVKKIPDYDSGYDSLICDPLPYTTNVQEHNLPSFKLRIHGLDGLVAEVAPRLTPDITKLYIATCLISGDSIRPLSISATEDVDFSVAPRWDETVLPNHKTISYSSILRPSKIAFLLVGRISDRDKIKDVPLAWCTQQVFDGNDNILIGRHSLELWPLCPEDNIEKCSASPSLGASAYILESKRTDDDKPRSKEHQRINTQLNPNLCKGIDLSLCSYLFRGSNSTNTIMKNSCRLTISFDYFALQVIAPQGEQHHYIPNRENPILLNKLPRELKRDERQIFQSLLSQDALYVLSDVDKKVLWSVRETLLSTPIMLPFVLQSCDFNDIDMRYEMYRLLDRWSPPENPAQIINLLDYCYADHRIRSYAVKQLEQLSLGHLQMYLLQLTQCLKFESYHNSPLSRFLINNAINHPYQIGHFLYWNLKNEMQFDPPFAERFKCILEAFLTYCPVATDQLRVQQQVIDKLRMVATKVQQNKPLTTDSELSKLCHNEMNALNRDFFKRIRKFQSPLDPREEVSQVILEKCKIMSSKMAPLWLVFKNADPKGDNIYTIFKAGDDLRQDILTLQILRFMDEIWLQNGMDLRLSPYNVIATGMNTNGKGCGMIQVVLNSQTTAGIQMAFGGAFAAFKETSLSKYIQDHNPTPEAYANAIENFIRSCAGYCVATYALGIGDRHNGNIMITKDGYLFHIDFGHFLGNFKYKLGLKRERAAFVFTPEMAYVMGGKNFEKSKEYEKFCNLCFDAYLLLRKHAYELETLFITMVGAGMPELLNKEDIDYLRNQLCLDMSEDKAKAHFKSELKRAVTSTSRLFDNFVHLLKHSNKA